MRRPGGTVLRPATSGTVLRATVGGRAPVASLPPRRREDGVLLLLALGALADGAAPRRFGGGALLLLLALGALFAPVPAPAAGPARSGRYGELALVVTGDAVSGVLFAWHGGTAAAPQFSCRFFLRGRLRHGRGAVESWGPDGTAIPGSLAVSDGGVALLLSDNHAGCAATAGDMTRQPFQAVRTLRGEGWIGVAAVGARRAVLRPAPADPPPRRPAVLPGEAVAVLERRGAWVRVSRLDGERPPAGWLRAAELAPDAGPGGSRAAPAAAPEAAPDSAPRAAPGFAPDPAPRAAPTGR
ncbi:hypothetical protein [Roseomonas sp. BN140053]|uniref:hypothetical protein n=1 Tax=Roseomonas sp. BN140053 TaxID=3391898 RepID=UPI0039E9C026